MSIRSTQSSVLKFVKKWLNLPHNCTPTTVFHPDVLDLPFLPHFKELAKLSFIFAIECSVDPLIIELRQFLFIPNCQDVSEIVFDTLSDAEASVSNIKSATFKNNALKNFHSCYANYWESELELLTVQNKFLDLVALDQQCLLWRLFMYGLLEKQLSFLLCAGSDTLPTSINLAGWNIIVSPVCSLVIHTNLLLQLAVLPLLTREGILGTTIQYCRFLFRVYSETTTLS